MVKISVIMPVYNSEKYLEKAIDSVLKQTFTDWELILIDDGSKDKSGAVCDQYAKLDGRVIAIHQHNVGITNARNRGLMHASGEYIGFIDNDDYFEKTILEEAYLNAKRYDSDVVKFGYYVEESFRNEGIHKRQESAQRVIKLNRNVAGSFIYEVKKAGYFNVIWNGIYKKEFLNINQLKFDEKITYGYEDWIFNFKAFPKANRQVLLPDIGYRHYQRFGHSTSKKFHLNQLYALKTAALQEKEMFFEIGCSKD